MRLALLTLPFTMLVLVLGCRLDNPAFEDGQEFGDDQASVETHGDEQDGSSTDESGDADQGSSDSNTLDGSSTATSDAESTTSDAESTTTNDGSTSESTSEESTSEESTSEESSSTDVDSFSDTLDGPIMACPIVDVIIDCKTCIQAHCCFEESDMGCLDGSDPKCTCVLDCLIDTNAQADCAMACEAADEPFNHASGMYTCTINQCEQWC
jgi:hypothetical protein